MEDFITYELAIKLKEKGFPLKYKIETKSWSTECERIMVLPSIYEVLKWLRETYKLFISPCVIADYQDDFHRNTTYWSFIVVNIESGDSIYREYERVTENRFDSYEEATLAGIEYVLDNLI